LLLIAGSQAKQVLHVLYLPVQLRNKAEEPSFTFTPDFFLDAAVFRHPVSIAGQLPLSGLPLWVLVYQRIGRSVENVSPQV
jgi:hypothetical protein